MKGLETRLESRLETGWRKCSRLCGQVGELPPISWGIAQDGQGSGGWEKRCALE